MPLILLPRLKIIYNRSNNSIKYNMPCKYMNLNYVISEHDSNVI